MHKAVIQDAWEHVYQNNNPLLFGARQAAIDLSTLHPEQVQIFRLWQIYLENVNPLLKVTHTPTLQGRIIDAAGNLASIQPSLAALMFSIYCVSLMSLAEDECSAIFASSKEELLAKYHFGCEQALSDCDFLRSDDRESLTAFHLYLVSLSSASSAISSLILSSDFCDVRHRSPVCFLCTWRCDPYRATYGPSQRVGQRQMHPF